MIYRLYFRDPAVPTGGAVVPGFVERRTTTGTWVVGPDARLALAREARIVFLIHGFNVALSAGRDRLLRFSEELSSQRGAALVSVLWPGDHWAGPLSYPFEGGDADDTAERLAAFVDELALPAHVPLAFVAHSLGCRVALEALRRLPGRSRDVTEVCLLAPAVDNDCLAHLNKYRTAVARLNASGKPTRFCVVHSVEDEVLRFAYPVGDWLRSVFTLWRDDPGFALGYKGPRALTEPRPGDIPANVSSVAVGSFRVDHDDYLPLDGQPELSLNRRASARFTDAFLAGGLAPYLP